MPSINPKGIPTPLKEPFHANMCSWTSWALQAATGSSYRRGVEAKALRRIHLYTFRGTAVLWRFTVVLINPQLQLPSTHEPLKYSCPGHIGLWVGPGFYRSIWERRLRWPDSEVFNTEFSKQALGPSCRFTRDVLA